MSCQLLSQFQTCLQQATSGSQIPEDLELNTKAHNILGSKLETTWDNIVTSATTVSNTSTTNYLNNGCKFLLMYMPSNAFNIQCNYLVLLLPSPLSWVATNLPVNFVFWTRSLYTSLVLVAISCTLMTQPWKTTSIDSCYHNGNSKLTHPVISWMMPTHQTLDFLHGTRTPPSWCTRRTQQMSTTVQRPALPQLKHNELIQQLSTISLQL